MTLDQLFRLALALAIGLLIGAERGWQSRDEQPGARVAGIRTFSLLGLLGGASGLQIGQAGFVLFILFIAGAVLGLLLGYRADMVQDRNVSATSTIAAVLTLGWGAASGSGQMALASVGAGATVLILASRQALHRMIALVSEDDVKATLRLVLVVLVVLPLLPDYGMGPLGALNPRRIWLVVVTTGAISFLGYVLCRWLGSRRSVLIAAGVGAMVSSTAVTLDCARRLRDGSSDRSLHAAVPLASAVMLGRSLVLVALLAPTAIGAVSVTIAPALLVSVLAGAVLLGAFGTAQTEPASEKPRPPGLGIALVFALSVAVLALATAWVESRWGDRNAALIIASGGTFDIDAAIAAVGALPAGTLSARAASIALATPTLLNTLFKLFLLISIAGFRRSLAGATALSMIALVLGASIGILLLRAA
jgi:uncharacterized membrane protein (DUF4010 family)